MPSDRQHGWATHTGFGLSTPTRKTVLGRARQGGNDLEDSGRTYWFGVIIIGLGSVAAELFEPSYFAQIYKDLNGIGGFQVHTNVIGFGIFVVGSALLAVACSGNRSDDI
jgi:hypothetical protein